MRTGDVFFAVILLGGCALLALLLWWCSRSGLQRTLLLLDVAITEHTQELPPERFLDQGHWLVMHRLGMLHSLSLVWIGAGGLGLIEGADRRRRHPLRGMQYTPFLLGKGFLMSTLGLAVAVCFCPWPLHMTLLAAVGSVCLVNTTYWLAAGFPLVH
jgi:hypothetical protein